MARTDQKGTAAEVVQRHEKNTWANHPAQAIERQTKDRESTTTHCNKHDDKIVDLRYS